MATRTKKSKGRGHHDPEPLNAQQLLQRVFEVYRNAFGQGGEALEFPEAIGLRDEQIFERHQLGYCSGNLANILPKQEQDPSLWNVLNALGIILPDGRERLAGRIVAPLFDVQGKLSSLCGIPIEPDLPPIVLPPESSGGLWNLPALPRFSKVILVDSILDGLSLEAAGVDNVLALVRSAGLSGQEIQAFQICHIQQVHVLIVKDGLLEHALPTIEAQLGGIGIKCFSLPGRLAPTACLQAHGPEHLAMAIAQAVNQKAPPAQDQNIEALDDGFALNLASRRYMVRGLEKGPRKMRATLRIEQAGKIHVDTLDFYSARWRRQLIGDVSRIFDKPAETIESEVMKIIEICENQVLAPSPSSAQQEFFMSSQAREQAQAFGKDSDLIQNILNDYDQCGLVGEHANKLVYYLAAVSRKMDHPLSVLILSSSGAGKSTLQDAALQFCPPEDRVKITFFTGKALYYKEQTSLKHKVLALEEGEGMAEASYALRSLVSSGCLVIETTVKDATSGKLTTQENRVEGPTAVFLTTTSPTMDPETQSRFIVISADEGRQQTQAILQSQRRGHTLEGLAEESKRKQIFEKHQNFQRLLKPLAVINPYAGQLTYGDGRLQSRRDQPKYLNLIRAVALLRQMQKTVLASANGVGQSMPYIEVDLEDIRLANNLINQIMGHSLDELSGPGYALLMILEALTKEAAPSEPECHMFTRRQIREYTGWSHSRVHRYLKELLTLEYVLEVGGRFGYLRRFCLPYRGEGKDGGKFLLGLKSVEELIQPEHSSARCTPFSPLFHTSNKGQPDVHQPDNSNSVQMASPGDTP